MNDTKGRTRAKSSGSAADSAVKSAAPNGETISAAVPAKASKPKARKTTALGSAAAKVAAARDEAKASKPTHAQEAIATAASPSTPVAPVAPAVVAAAPAPIPAAAPSPIPAPSIVIEAAAAKPVPTPVAKSADKPAVAPKAVAAVAKPQPKTEPKPVAKPVPSPAKAAPLGAPAVSTDLAALSDEAFSAVGIPRLPTPDGVVKPYARMMETGADSARAAYAQAAQTNEALTQACFESANAASRGLVALNGQMLDLMRANTDLTLSLMRSTLSAGSLSEAIKLQTSGAREAFETTSAHMKAMAEATTKLVGETTQPLAAAITRR